MRRPAANRVVGGLLVCVMTWASIAPAQDAPASAATVQAPPVPPPVPVEIPFASRDAAGVTSPSSPDAWGGPRHEGQEHLSDRVVSYRIQATLDPVRHRVDGREQLTWRNRSDRPVSAVFLHLYLNAFESEGSTFFTERRTLSPGHARGAGEVGKGEWGYIDLSSVEQDGATLKWRHVHPDGGPQTDHTVVRVDLAQPVAPGASVTLGMTFQSQLPRVIERTGYVGDFHLVAQWFPKIGVLELPGERGATEPRWNVHEFHFNSEFYADFGDYDVQITLPKDYVVAAVGEQQGAPVVEGGQATWRFTQGDVHDFAWMAARDFLTRETTWQGPGSPPVAVKVVYPREYEAVAGPILKASTDSLTYFSRTLGPYPYRTVTAVVPPFHGGEAGGMEYPTFYTVDNALRVVPGTLAQILIDFTTIHEFGHGYFYGLLASNEFEEPMLDEGLNEFWDDRMLSERRQGVHMTTPFLRFFGIDPEFGAFVFERMTASLAAAADPLGQNSWNRLSNAEYGTVYSRTATAMHDLEQRLGSEVMGKAFHAYYERWKFRHPSIADFRQSLVEASGRQDIVDEVFSRYVHGVAYVDDRVSDITSTEVLPLAGLSIRDGKRVELSSDDNDDAIEKQRNAWHRAHPGAAEGTGPFPWRTTVTVWRDGEAVPQVLKVTFADGAMETVNWNDGRRWARFDFTHGAKAVSAELDPERRIYLDTNKLNDSRTVEADHSASTRWSSDIAAVLQGFYAWMGTL